MKIKNLKWIKVSGIIFLVALLIFLSAFGIISALKAEKIYVNSFADKVITEAETKTDLFTTSSNSNVRFTDEVNFMNAVNNNINLKYEYYLPYFSSVGVNTFNKSYIAKQVKKIETEANATTKTYDSLKQQYTPSISTDAASGIKTVFYQTYLTNYRNLLNEKFKLVNYLEKIIKDHKIENSFYTENVFTSSSIALNIAFNVNFEQLINKQSKDVSLANTTRILNLANTNFSQYLLGNKNLITDFYQSSMLNFKIANSQLLKEYKDFETTLKSLSKEQKAAMQADGTHNFISDTTDSKLISIYNFLKVGGIYDVATSLTNSNAIAVGISNSANF